MQYYHVGNNILSTATFLLNQYSFTINEMINSKN